MVPVNVTPPVVACDNPRVGEIAELTRGTWDGDKSMLTEWYTDDGQLRQTGGKTTYTIATEDVGHSIYVRETATSPEGSASVESDLVGPVRTAPGGAESVDDAIDNAGEKPTTDEVLDWTRHFSAREIAAAAVSIAKGNTP